MLTTFHTFDPQNSCLSIDTILISIRLRTLRLSEVKISLEDRVEMGELGFGLQIFLTVESVFLIVMSHTVHSA